MNMNGWMGESGLGAGRMRENWDTLSTENGWYPGGVAVHGGYNGIKTFQNESLRAEKRSTGELLCRFVGMKPINRTFDQIRRRCAMDR